MLRCWLRLWTSRRACSLSRTVLAAVLDAHMMAEGRAAALGVALLTVVLIDGRTAAALAFASSAAVLTDGAAAAALE